MTDFREQIKEALKAKRDKLTNSQSSNLFKSNLNSLAKKLDLEKDIKVFETEKQKILEYIEKLNSLSKLKKLFCQVYIY
jgi:predicted phage-related endonuclease